MGIFDGLLGGGGTRQQTQTSSAQLDPRTQALNQTIQAGVTNQLNQPYQSYTGKVFANQNQDTKAGMQGVRDMQGVGQGQYASAQGAAQAAAGYTPQNVSGQSFLGGQGIQQYMDPYQSQVISGMQKQAMQGMNRQANQLASQAQMSGAGVGSRAGIESGIMRAQGLNNLSQQTGQLLSQGYSQAAALKQADMNRALRADMANQSAGLQGQQINIAGARALGDLTNQQRAAGYQDARAMAQVGAMGEARDQRQLDYDRNEWLTGQNWNKDQLSWGAGVQGSLPQAQTTTMSSPQTKADPMNALLGLGMGVGGAYLMGGAGAAGAKAFNNKKG